MEKSKGEILKIVQEIVHRLDIRGIGHSSAMAVGAKAYNTFTLFNSVDDGKHWNISNSNILTLNTLNRLRGSKKPLLIDHVVISNLFKELLKIISEQTHEIKDLTPKDFEPNLFGTPRKLLVSRIQTPDGTILTSYHRHDYKTHVDKNDLTYMLDGGNDYQRVIVNNEAPHTDVSIYEDDPFEEIRKYYCLYINHERIPLCDCSENILRKQLHPMFNNQFSKKYIYYLLEELLYRFKNSLIEINEKKNQQMKYKLNE
jgi:hypothetical protein